MIITWAVIYAYLQTGYAHTLRHITKSLCAVLIRIHQFEKVEQFVIASPEGNASWEAMEEMLANSEDFYQVNRTTSGWRLHAPVFSWGAALASGVKVNF